MKISFQCRCGVLSCIVFIVTQDPKFCTKPNQPGNALKLYTSSAYANGLRNSNENARNTMVIHGVSGSNSILLRFLYQLTIRNEKSDFCTFRRITDPVLYFVSFSFCLAKKYYLESLGDPGHQIQGDHLNKAKESRLCES